MMRIISRSFAYCALWRGYSQNLYMEGLVQMQQTSQRPLGITILAVLSAIGGLFGILGALGLFALGSVSGLAPLFGVVALVLAVAQLAFAYGAWTLQPWAWMLGIGLQGLSILLNILYVILGWSNIGSIIVSVIISGIIIYYLMTPEIKKAFGQPA